MYTKWVLEREVIIICVQAPRPEVVLGILTGAGVEAEMTRLPVMQAPCDIPGVWLWPRFPESSVPSSESGSGTQHSSKMCYFLSKEIKVSFLLLVIKNLIVSCNEFRKRFLFVSFFYKYSFKNVIDMLF